MPFGLRETLAAAVARGVLLALLLVLLTGGTVAFAWVGLVAAPLCLLERAVPGREADAWLRDHALVLLLWPMVVALLVLAFAQRPYVDALMAGATFPAAAEAALGWVAVEWHDTFAFDSGGFRLVALLAAVPFVAVFAAKTRAMRALPVLTAVVTMAACLSENGRDGEAVFLFGVATLFFGCFGGAILLGVYAVADAVVKLPANRGFLLRVIVFGGRRNPET